ncbi:prepilin-type N-terminal cleavage/methylation domain-containing protein [Anoxybacillus sp. ST4]|uniref:prepilin-type N-terminal cleavage/methylation domain-containing protein n=1 Tax=Anoxybacillus sp. ST4 TaxID=2864181 RepID=UPI001C63BD8C|nr:prepilin-type N-terminal cleavage/methylation domain-containing protein [Anoxybacillus sp. ST4]MBW7650788.1 prepilin-type N-terminal cleavage/methylation domain-containing protein [Anoxybacillus sp. ST4]
MLKKLIRNEKGLTLIELLAVIVILGIIAAIAIPSIGGLIDNSKKDAHVANAQQMINAAKIAVTADKSLIPSSGQSQNITLKKLEDDGYLETVKDPDNGTYNKEGSFVTITNSNNKLSYSVKLINNKRGVQTSTGGAVAEESLARSQVVDNPATPSNP